MSVFVDQSAQDGSSVDLLSIDVGHHRAGSVTFAGRDALGYALVGPGGAVVVLIFREDSSQVRFTGGSVFGRGLRGAACRRGAHRSRSSWVPERR